jgi:hypothetical protein
VPALKLTSAVPTSTILLLLLPGPAPAGPAGAPPGCRAAAAPPAACASTSGSKLPESKWRPLKGSNAWGAGASLLLPPLQSSGSSSSAASTTALGSRLACASR